MAANSRLAEPTIDGPALDAAARQVGDRWSLLVLAALQERGRTFGELAGELAGIAPNILSSRLRSLQRLALVTATPYADRPPRMRYSLTEEGHRLGEALASLAEWGARREGRRGRVHDACGSTVELRAWCPTCDRPLTGDDRADDLVWC